MGPCLSWGKKKKDALEERTTLLLAFLFLLIFFFLITRLNPKSYPDKSRAWSSTQRRGFNWTEKEVFTSSSIADTRNLKYSTCCTNVTVDLVERGRNCKFHSFKVYIYAKAIKNIGRFSIKKRTKHAKYKKRKGNTPCWIDVNIRMKK